MNLSVIIPAFNEEGEIAETIRCVQDRGDELLQEVIVVDGGSMDATVKNAKEAGAKVVVSSQKGRAAQMNYGAEKAAGDIFYFLHADSKPPQNFANSVCQAVESGYDAGCFRLTFDQNHVLLDVYAWFTRFDIDAFRFGDQSLFIRSNAFWAIGGYRNNHIVMEDNEIVRRIKEEYTFAILDDAVETSARMYREVGVLRLQLIFVLIYTLYFLGVEQETLANIKSNV